MGKNEMEYKAVMDLNQLKGYLESFAQSLSEGTIYVAKGDEQVALTPTDPVKVEIAAKVKKDKSKFSLELSWRNEVEAKEDDAELTISAVPPEPPEPVPAEETGGDGGEETGEDDAETRRHGE